jgi:hypothetical protein
MNTKNIAVLSIFSSLALVASVNILPSEAQTRNIYNCLQYRNQPTTVVDTTRGRIQLIVWKSGFFSSAGWTPEKRCQVVTQRFQKFSDNGTLRYIATGRMNNAPVICVAEKKPSGFKCLPNGLLITLQPNDNPSTVLKDMFDISSRISSGGLTRGGDILDLEEFLQNVPTTNEIIDPEKPNNPDNNTSCPTILCPSNQE